VAEKTVKRIAIPKIEQKIIETFTTLQIQALLEACHQNSNKAYAERDRTIVALLLDTGIRAGELCTLTLDNLYLDNPHDAYIRVHGKGDKWREVGLGVETLKMLRKYLAHQRKNAGEQAYVFPGHGEGQLTINALDHVFYRL